MKNKVFGLDIGATTIKAVWLEKSKDGYILDAVYTMPAPVKGMLSESPLDQEEMAGAIAKVIQEANIDARSANIALPESQVFTKVIEMPILSDKELASAIYWEAEQYIPVPLNTITLDYKVLYRPGPNDPITKMSVLLVGAPSTLIDKYEKIMTMSGISINALETEILSVSRALILGQEFPSTLIINIGALSTSLAIVKNNILTFTYFIPTGGVALSRAIASDLGFSIPQAEEYKRVYGLEETNFGGKIGKAAEPVLTSILSEVKKAMAFYAERFPQDPIKQILLSGGSAKLPGLSTYFAENSGIESVVANPWKVLASQEVPKEILDDAPEYAIAIGLAMREYE